MILCQLRKHLADEIRNFPGKPNAATQRYALTTAALARKILDYLNAENLTLPNGFRLDTGDLPLPNGFRPPASYKLRDVLDCIIHFRLLDQDDEFSRYRPTFDLIRLYSDENMQFGDHLYIRLADYRDMLNRLATDDLLVAQYLLSCTNTLLNKVVVLDKPSERERREKKWAKIKDEIKDKPPQERKKKWAKMKEDIEKEWARMEDSQRSIDGFVANTWDILLALSHAGKVEMPLSPIDCYEKLDAGEWKKYSRFPTCREFFYGYLKIWRWARPNFIKVQIEGHGTLCMVVNEIKLKENGTLRRLAIPLDTLICFFTAVRKQIG